MKAANFEKLMSVRSFLKKAESELSQIEKNILFPQDASVELQDFIISLSGLINNFEDIIGNVLLISFLNSQISFNE